MRFSLRCCVVAVCACVPVFAQPGGVAAPVTVSVRSLCFLPLKVTGIADGDALLIADALRTQCAATGKLDVLDKSKAIAAMREAKQNPGDECIKADCAIPAGEKAEASLVAAASLGKIGTLFTFTIALYNVKEQRRLLYRDYQYRGGIEDFYTDVPRRIAEDIAAAVPAAPPAETPPPPSPVLAPPPAPLPPPEITAEAAPVIDSTPVREAEKPKQPEGPENYGVVTAPAIGITGRVAAGTLGNNQSRWGAMAYYVHPTGKNSQARVKLGMPLAGSDTIFTGTWKGIPDVYGSIEHEWGLKYFGVGIGLAVMQMKTADRIYYSTSISYDTLQRITMYDTVPTTVHYKSQYGFNWILNLRAGKPNAGFKARLSWPIPFSDDPTQNSFFEYSALGIFGGGVFKGGIGIAGMYRSREAEAAVAPASSGYNQIRESYAMAPSGKFAVLIAKHNVVWLGIDFMGIIVPRIGSDDTWAPNLQLGYTFSFGKLLDPEVLDGTF
jgi:hypothetical protein